MPIPLLQQYTLLMAMITHRVTNLMSSSWFLEHDSEFTILKWSLQSSDFNPIEHLWNVVEQEIRIMDDQPGNLQQSCDAIMSIMDQDL